jgi:hypothetical protein
MAVMIITDLSLGRLDDLLLATWKPSSDMRTFCSNYVKATVYTKAARV